MASTPSSRHLVLVDDEGTRAHAPLLRAPTRQRRARRTRRASGGDDQERQACRFRTDQWSAFVFFGGLRRAPAVPPPPPKPQQADSADDVEDPELAAAIALSLSVT